MDSIRKKYDEVDFVRQKEVMIFGLHKSGTSNIAHNERKDVWAAVAGQIFVRSDDQKDLRWGASSIASAWVGGSVTPNQADGAFACVVYDPKIATCFAFNDFAGQIPLFYTSFKGATYFASQLAPFLLNENIPIFIDKRGLNLFLSFGCIPGSDTITAGIKKLRPATLAIIGRRTVQLNKFWKIGNIRVDYSKPIDDFIESVETLLSTSVRLKLSNVRRPVGVLLGGLDSSLTAALIRKCSSERVRAITASFEDSRFNEHAVREVSNLLELDLTEVPVTSEDMPEIIEMMAEAFDEPVSDMIACPIGFAVTKKSLGLVDTLFDGTGADSLFEGSEHSARKLDVMMESLPLILQNGFHSTIERALHLLAITNYGGGLVSPILVPQTERDVISRRSMQADQVKALLANYGRVANEKVPTDPLHRMVKEINSEMHGTRQDPANNSAKMAVSRYISSTHGFGCSRNRAISNKLGITIISPFYDKNLYSEGLSVPWYFKTPLNGLSKPLLRKVAITKKLLPAHVALLKKKGLGSSKNSLVNTQMNVWATNELSGWISEMIEKHLGLVGHLMNRGQVRTVINKGRASEIFQILMFVLWYKHYFGERAIPFQNS